MTRSAAVGPGEGAGRAEPVQRPTGPVAANRGQGPGELAAEALRAGETDPVRALALADEVEAWTGAEEVGPFARGLAAWARGRANRLLGRNREAQAALESAVALLARSGDRRLAASASVRLALERIDAGRIDDAIDLLDGVAGDLSGTEMARAAAQRALALQRGGRVVDATEGWDAAVEAFGRAGMAVEAAVCRESRGLVLAYRGELELAEADLVAAEATFTRCGDHVRAAEAVHNRGFVAARQGDLPRALSFFDQAQSRAAELGALRPAMLVDRVEVCLQAGLVAEARALAEEAVGLLDQAGLGADVPEACLLAARACEHDGDPVASARWAGRAEELFEAQRRPRWGLLARYARVRAEVATGPPSEDLACRLAEVARQLRAGGWPTQAAEADVEVVEVLVATRRLREAQDALELLLPSLRRALPLARLRLRLCQARLALATGDARVAERALAAGLRAFSAYQGTLGSLELRAAGGGRAGELMALGIGLARHRGAPARGLWWMEAVRAAQGGGAEAGRRDPEIEAALADLRQVMASQGQEGLSAREATLLRRRQSALEEVVRRRSRHAAGLGPPGRALGTAALTRALGQRLLVEYAAVGADLVAAVLYRGECRLVELCRLTEARQAVAHLRLALQLAVRRPGSGLPALEQAAGAVQELLLVPLEAPPAPEVAIVADGALSSVPWGSLELLRGATVVVATSAEDLVRPRVAPPAQRQEVKVVVVVGPGLRHGGEEAEAIEAAWGGTAQALRGGRARFSVAEPAMNDADVVHVAAHGSFRGGNPLLSSIRLDDGPVTGDELARATKRARLVVLSCCDSAMADSSGVGLSRLLHQAGALGVIASVSPVSDASSVPLMKELHRHLASGASPAAALVAARRAATGPPQWASSAGFVCFGSGFAPVVSGKPPERPGPALNPRGGARRRGGP